MPLRHCIPHVGCLPRQKQLGAQSYPSTIVYDHSKSQPLPSIVTWHIINPPNGGDWSCRQAYKRDVNGYAYVLAAKACRADTESCSELANAQLICEEFRPGHPEVHAFQVREFLKLRGIPNVYSKEFGGDRKYFLGRVICQEDSKVVRSRNNPPTVLDDSVTTDEDTAITINVLANDSDVDGDKLKVGPVSAASNGGRRKTDTTITYTPRKDFNGVDQFTYIVTDGRGGRTQGNVTVTVNPVNDKPKAVADAATTLVGQPVVIDVLANDVEVDGDQLLIQAVRRPSNGKRSHDGKFITYTPNPGFSGTDEFRYVVSDGNGETSGATVTVNVLAAQ